MGFRALFCTRRRYPLGQVEAYKLEMGHEYSDNGKTGAQIRERQAMLQALRRLAKLLGQYRAKQHVEEMRAGAQEAAEESPKGQTQAADVSD